MMKLVSSSTILLLSGFCLSSMLFTSCGGEKEETPEVVVSNSYISTINKPESGSAYVEGDKIPFKISFSDKGKSVVKTDILLNNKNILSSVDKNSSVEFELASDTMHLGPQNIKIEVELTDGMVEKYEYEIMLLSKTAPEMYSYKVVNKYPHDVNAYTQGLVFENGYMYEGTGQKGQSEIRLVDFKVNKVLKSQKLDNSIFGEGVAVIGDKIFQLSWQNKRGFVYDKSSFKLLKEFNYPTEGWGLAYDGTDLILSDGTPVIYFYDPLTFTLKRKIVVVDNVAPVGLLNELEYINGEIWANVYQTNFIVRIDPKTGRVNSKIDFVGLLTDQEQMQNVDVLNGIAYDPNANKLFVTGKLWPWLFEVELTKPK